MDMSDQLHAPIVLPPEEIAPDTHWIGGWVGPRAGLDTALAKGEKNHCPCRESDPDRPERSLAITLTELCRLQVQPGL